MQKTTTTTRAKKENVESILTFRNTYDFKSNTKELAKKDITFIIWDKKVKKFVKSNELPSLPKMLSEPLEHNCKLTNQ